MVTLAALCVSCDEAAADNVQTETGEAVSGAVEESDAELAAQLQYRTDSVDGQYGEGTRESTSLPSSEDTGGEDRQDGVPTIATAEQCIVTDTNTSVESFEEVLIKEGIIRGELDKMVITKEMCEEIMERTPGGTLIERAVAAENLNQELNLIQQEITTAVAGDVNGDGIVDAEDSNTASAASSAASRAAQTAARTSLGAIPSQGDLQEIAGAAAGRAGASSTAASAGGDCAAEVTLLDGTLLKTVQGNMAFTSPPEEMDWKDDVTISLVVSPSTLTSIEELRQQIEEAAETGEVGSCIGLTNQMEANLISEADGFAVTALTGDDPIQMIASNDETTWSWNAEASNTGSQPLHLDVRVHLSSEEGSRSVSPPPFSEEIAVRARLDQKAKEFFGNNWQWLWTAILVPVAVWLWRRYRGSNENRETSSRS